MLGSMEGNEMSTDKITADQLLPSECEIEVVKGHAHPNIKDPAAIWEIWLAYYYQDKAGITRRLGAWSIGNKIRYTRDEAIEEANQIHQTTGIRAERIDPE
jgi:hypothetical protein